jgi:hypothetical protein
VKELHRSAERHIGCLDAAFERRLVGAAHQVQIEPCVMEEDAEKRHHVLKHELVGESNARPSAGDQQRFEHPAQQFIAFAKGIGSEIRQLALARGFVVERAATAPGEQGTRFVDDGAKPFDSAFVTGPAAAGRSPADE